MTVWLFNSRVSEMDWPKGKNPAHFTMVVKPVVRHDFLENILTHKIFFLQQESYPHSFQISPYFRNISQTLSKIFPLLPFPKKCFDFHPPKFLMTFFSHWLKILNSPLFQENYFPLHSQIFPLWFCKIYVFFTYFVFFRFPPSLAMMHFCTHWKPLRQGMVQLYCFQQSTPESQHITYYLVSDTVWGLLKLLFQAVVR